MHQYENIWKLAKESARGSNLSVIEHGWEQHVIVDEENGVVYRYPRHSSALAKLEDEVSILAHLNKLTWPVPIPQLTDFNGQRASYKYIAGDVLDDTRLASLSDAQLDTIGQELGEFLATLHQVDPGLIEHKSWRQKGTLLAYYQKRIQDTHDDNPWKSSGWNALHKLLAARDEIKPAEVVVHGDLHGLNTVITADGNHLAGVIDLSEIELGDPHQDFRKIFMTDARLLPSALLGYQQRGGASLSEELVKLWAYVNEWSNLCHFASDPHNATYQRAIMHLERWKQI